MWIVRVELRDCEILEVRPIITHWFQFETCHPLGDVLCSKLSALGTAFACAIDQRGLRPNDIQMASTHPQSTCRMSEDLQRGVVNSWCRSHEIGNLFVCDMGVFPTSLGAPPQITTAALGDRTAHYIRDNWPKLSA
jgi:choline dehydrogenase-like flavoprotein